MSFSAEALEQELSTLLLNKSLSETDNIDPVTVLSVPNVENGKSGIVAYMRTPEEFDNHLRSPSASSFSTRLYAVHQSNSWSWLNLSSAMLKRITLEHCLMPQFLKMLTGFCYKTQNVDTSYAPAFESCLSETYMEYAYVLKYAERRLQQEHTKEEPWTIRQLALYHSYDVCKRQSVYVLVSPNSRSRAEADVIAWLERAQEYKDVYNGHFKVHEILLSYHLQNWGPYMRFYDAQLTKIASQLTDAKAEYYLTAPSTRHADLHFLESRFLPIGPALKSTLLIMNGVQRLLSSHKRHFREQPNQQADLKRLKGHIATYRSQIITRTEQSQVLLKRCTSTIALLGPLTTSSDQKVARQQNADLMELTKLTLHDSNAIRAITVISLLYLSLTTVATVMGTPFFKVNESGNLSVSSDLWIFASISLSLTLASFVFWRWLLRRRRRQRSRVPNPDATGDAPV